MSTAPHAADRSTVYDSSSIEALIKSAVSLAVLEAMSAQIQVLGNILGREFGKGFKEMSANIRSLAARYEEELDVLEEAVISMGDKLNKTVLNPIYLYPHIRPQRRSLLEVGWSDILSDSSGHLPISGFSEDTPSATGTSNQQRCPSL